MIDSLISTVMEERKEHTMTSLLLYLALEEAENDRIAHFSEM